MRGEDILVTKQKKAPRLRRLKYWFLLRAGVPVAYALIHALHRTWRIKRTGEQNAQRKPAIYAIWHGDLILGATELAWLPKGMDVLASRSRDGNLVAHYTHMSGGRTIRGSSSSGAAHALLSMRRTLLRGRSVVIPIDGPRGPAEVVKPGVIAVSSQTGVPIVPGAVLCNNVWRFTSWDRAFVGKPFAEVTFVYGEPIYVEPNASREQIEAARQLLEQRLKELHYGKKS